MEPMTMEQMSAKAWYEAATERPEISVLFEDGAPGPAIFGDWSMLLEESIISLIDRLLRAGLGKSRQVYASKPRREILIYRLLGAGLGKSRQV